MGFEPMTKGATILYSTNWATISIFVPSKESNLHTYNVFLYLLSRVIMIQYHEDASYCSAASPIYALNRHFVGVAGFEPAQPKHLIYSQARLSNGGELPFISYGRQVPPLRPPVPKTGILLTELLPYLYFTDLSMTLKSKKELHHYWGSSL